MGSRHRSFVALLVAVLIPLIYARALLDVRDSVLQVDGNATILDSVELAKNPFGLVRRDPPPTGFNLCRSSCSFQNVRGSSIKSRRRRAVKRSLESNAIEARTLAPQPMTVGGMNTFMVNLFDNDPNFIEVYSAADGVQSSAVFRSLIDSGPINMGVQILCGCTILVVVSQEAVYFAHYFEDLAFQANEGDPPADFQQQVINFLNNGLPRLDGTGNYPSLAANAASFQTNVNAYIMTPQAEDDNAPAGQVIYLPGVRYNDKVIQLKNRVAGILDPQGTLDLANRIPIVTYQALDAGLPGGPRTPGLTTLENTAKGRGLYQFDPDQSTNRQKARLFFEGSNNAEFSIVRGRIYQDTWEKPPASNQLFTLPKVSGPTSGLLSCGDRFFNESEYTCFDGAVLCPILKGVPTLPCGSDCYLQSKYSCDGDFLCPILDGIPTLRCGSDCYLPSQYGCDGTHIVQLPPVPPSATTATTQSSQGSEIVFNGTTFTLGPQPSTITKNNGQTIIFGSSTLVIGSQTITLPSITGTGPITITTGSITLTLEPVSAPGSTSTTGSHSVSSSSTEQPSVPSATEIVLGSSTFTLDSTSSTFVLDGSSVVLGPSGIVIGSQTISFPTATGTIAVTTGGITFTLEPVSSRPGASSSVTKIVFGGSTFTLGPTSSTVTIDGSTLVLGPSNIIIGTDTITLPATQTGPFAITTDGFTFSGIPGPASSSSTTARPTSTSSASPGSTSTASSPSSTTPPTLPQTVSTETLTASDGQSTMEVTFVATTLSQFSSVTAVTSIFTTENGQPTTLVVGSRGVVWTCSNCDTTRSGFPSISFPTQPPVFPTSASTPSPTSSAASNPFPSSQFSLPPVVTTVITTTGPNGPVTTTIVGTTNSGGAVVSVSTLQTAGAISSARGLASGIQGLSSIVSAFSVDPSNSASASAAVATVHSTNEDLNSFGRDLGIALAGLCIIFCSLVSSAASLLGTLEGTVAGIIAGTLGVSGLAGLLGALAGIAEDLTDAADEEESSSESESSSSSSSSCTVTAQTITDCEVICSTGSASNSAITSCFSTTCSAVTITACSASATTETSFEGGACPLSRPTAGPISILSYPGFTYIPQTDDGLTDSDTTTSPSTTFSTSTVSASPTPSCGAPQSCELNNCDGTVNSDGTATCKTVFEGCVCLPSSATPGFCGQQQSCELNGCAGTQNSDGTATCKGNFEGCQCIASSATPGFCGQQQSCELNGCAGTQNSDGTATCKGNFEGCQCIASSATPGFCGQQQSCELNGCAGTVNSGQGTSSSATCKGNFEGCGCIASANTPGFCGPLGSCQFADCAGRITNSGSNLGQCTGGTHVGCSCIPNAQTPGFCPSTDPSCSDSDCNGTPVGAGSAFGTCQSGSLNGCTCLVPSAGGGGGGGGGGSSDDCVSDCLAILTLKVNGLKDPICTNDPSNDFIDTGISPAGFTDWFRLASNQNCFLVLGTQSHTKGFPDGLCYPKSVVQDWITNNALGCLSGDAFFRPSFVLTATDPLAPHGIVCLSNFANYQKCGSSTMNGGTDFGAGGGINQGS